MSGVGFVIGWVDGQQRHRPTAREGPLRSRRRRPAIDKALAGLKDFNQNVVMTPGNAGTLDMLNRGEIAMGPVWVDMFYTWQADGKLTPTSSSTLIGAGPAGPADVLRRAGQGRQRRSWPKKFIELADQPRSAGRRHRQAVQLVPRHRPAVRPGRSSTRPTWNKLFVDVSPEDLRRQGQAVPDRPTSTTSSKATSAGAEAESGARARALGSCGIGSLAARRCTSRCLALALVAARARHRRPLSSLYPLGWSLVSRVRGRGTARWRSPISPSPSSSTAPTSCSRSPSVALATVITGVLAVAIGGYLTLGDESGARWRCCAGSTAGRCSFRSSSPGSACAPSSPRTGC